MLTGGPGDDGRAEALFQCQKGIDLVQSFKFTEGIEALETALEYDPELAEAAIGLVAAYGRMGREKEYKKSLALADSLTARIEDDDRRMVAQMRLGLGHKSRYGSMVDSLLTRLKEEQPQNIYVMVAQAEIAMMEGTHDEKVAAWQRILDKNPNYAEAYNRLGYLELHYGNFGPAVEHMKKYAFLAPDLANPHDSLGDVLMVKGDYEAAAAEFRAAIAKQPDFYYSYINLAKTMLFRGMIDDGVALMEKVHTMVEGTTLGQKVDMDLFETYLQLDMQPEVAQMSQSMIVNYPDSEMAAVVRAIRLGYMNEMQASQALMDSCMTHWRSQEYYHMVPSYRRNIDLTEKQYEAHIADIADNPTTRIRKWRSLIDAMEPYAAVYQMWPLRVALAKALLDDGQAAEARAQIEPILAANHRVVPALITAVNIDLALREPEGARMALEQLKWSIQQSDEDYIGRIQAAELEDRVLELEGHS